MTTLETSLEPPAPAPAYGKSNCPPRVPTEDELEVRRLIALKEKSKAESDGSITATTYHIYPLRNKAHKRITTTVDIERESPLSREGRKARKERKAGKEKERSENENEDEDALADKPNSTVTIEHVDINPTTLSATEHADLDHKETEDDAFFLHAPYLSFASPPSVLYIGKNNHTPSIPTVLIKGSALWRKYKLQYGDSLAIPGVLDPRGVVSWAHNGALKGYKVRTWRLWGECGKEYVHNVNANRKAGRTDMDPDIRDPRAVEKPVRPVEPEGIVYLRWKNPFSRTTREYRWKYNGIDFYWKGTSDTEKTGFWGYFVRFNHLKLVAVLPYQSVPSPLQSSTRVVVLARYTSSVSNKKHGRLEVMDRELLRLYERHVRDKRKGPPVETEEMRVKDLKKTTLYALVIATAVCMVSSEKAKRTMAGKWIKEAAQSADG